MKLSANFRLSEFAVSDSYPHLVKPVPGRYAYKYAGMVTLALQPARDIVGRIRVTSGYRSEALNKAVGGSATSQHRIAEAADLVPLEVSSGALFSILASSGTIYPEHIGQCIWYPSRGFVHLALPSDKYPSASLHVHMPEHGLSYHKVSSYTEAVRLVDSVAGGKA